MPPRGTEAGHRTGLQDPSLTDAPVRELGAWADARAPEGDALAAAARLPLVDSMLIRVDTMLRSDAPDTVHGDPEVCRCVEVDFPEPTERPWVSGFFADVDNDLVVYQPV